MTSIITASNGRTYREIAVVADVVFEVRRADQGQIVEYAYADGPRGALDRWVRVTDRSLPAGEQVRYGVRR